MNRYKLIATISSVGFYIIVVFLALYYFGYHFEEKKSVNFVDKNGTAIKVTLASPKRASLAPKIKKETKKRIKDTKTQKREHKKVIKKVQKPKKVTKPKREIKKVVKKSHPKKVTKKSLKKETKKIAKKETKKATPKPHQKPKKRIDAKKLFSSIKKSSKDTNQKKSKGGDSIKKEKKAKGISNEYLAKVQKALLNWPAQANFAGEEIDVILKIYPSGNFEYKVKKLSKNMEFNRELFAYLKQLKKVGFGPHNGVRAYEIEVKFIAHE